MSIPKEKKYKLGLALSGGGARGFAHPGVLKAFEDLGIKPDIISGTSAGALAGVLYADGYTSEEIMEMFSKKGWTKFAEIKIPTNALFGSTGFHKFLKKHLRTKNLEDLQIPVKVVTTNLDEGFSVTFDKGPIVDIVVASCSIPIIFAPVLIDGVHYVDGGLFKNFPVSTIREESETVIGVNVSPLVPKKYSPTIMNIAERSYHCMSRTNTLLDRELCDVLIEMKDIACYKTFDLESLNKIFDIGYENAKETLNKSGLIIQNTI